LSAAIMWSARSTPMRSPTCMWVTIRPPAPGLFSTMIGCPSTSPSGGPTRRSSRSPVPPAGDGVTRRIGRSGYRPGCAMDFRDRSQNGMLAPAMRTRRRKARCADRVAGCAVSGRSASALMRGTGRPVRGHRWRGPQNNGRWTCDVDHRKDSRELPAKLTPPCDSTAQGRPWRTVPRRIHVPTGSF